MSHTKIRAGHYTTRVQIGQFTIRSNGSRSWIVTNVRNRRIGKFDSLGEAEAWLASLTTTPASAASKNYLRDLLAAQAGSPLAEDIRDHFNALRQRGELISQAAVSKALDQLERAGRVRQGSSLPRQRRAESVNDRGEAVLPKAEAIRQARAALAKR